MEPNAPNPYAWGPPPPTPPRHGNAGWWAAAISGALVMGLVGILVGRNLLPAANHPLARATVTASATSTSGSSTGSGGNVVEMASVNFVQHSVSIGAGQAVVFKDPQSTGGFHILCLGMDQTCRSNVQGPSELNSASGLTFNAGDPDKSIVFPTAGIYTVTCTIHPNMTVTITVS